MAKKGTERGFRFERRDILKMMTGMPAAMLATAVPIASAVAGAAPLPQAATQSTGAAHPLVFNSHEWRTLRILSDWLIPADAQSGSATQAGVPEFIDDWLNLKQSSLLPEIQGGLTWLDMECHRAFGYDFADCSAARQKQILDRIAYPAKAAPEDAGGVAFFNTLRDLVISGFYTSRTGIGDLPYVGNEPQTQWKGCPEPVLKKLGVEEEKAKPQAKR